MDGRNPQNQSEHTRHTREAYDRLAPVWASTTDDGPFNGHLERPALRSLVPRPLDGLRILDAGCGSGAQCHWLLDEGADVVGIDLSPAMVAEAERRCRGRGRFEVADFTRASLLPGELFDGITCSLALHYVADWTVPLDSFVRLLRPNGWLVLSLDHPLAPWLPSQHGGYFDTELVSDTWTKAEVEVTQYFWRRPLGAVVEAFADAGFAIDRLVEARPTRHAQERFPELARFDGEPSFIAYRLRLMP